MVMILVPFSGDEPVEDLVHGIPVVAGVAMH